MCKLLLFLNRALLRDVHTIEELTDILVAHLALALDLSGRLGNSVDIVALEDKLVLDLVALLDDGVSAHVDAENLLLAQEVADLDLLVAVDHSVDGKVSVHETHLVAVALGDTSEHVLDGLADGANAGKLLLEALPLLDLDEGLLTLLDLGDLDVLVVIVALKLTAGAIDSDRAGLEGNLNALGDGHEARRRDGLHLACRAARFPSLAKLLWCGGHRQ